MSVDYRSPLSITVIHHPDDQRASSLVNSMAELLEGLGIERAGIFMRLPVRVRSLAITADGALRPVLPEASCVDVIIYCQSQHIEVDGAPFDALLQQIHLDFADQASLLFLPVLFDDVALPKEFGDIQGIRWFEWTGLSDRRKRIRTLIRIITDIHDHLDDDPGVRKSRVFVSHAKLDGKDIAKCMVRHVREPDNQLGLETFFDVLELRDGESFAEGLESGVRNSALVALVSDSYESRVWCNREVLLAKQNGRPALIIDVGRTRVARTFPYLGNLPLRCYDLTTSEGCDNTLLDLAVEMLRVSVFHITAAQLDPEATALPRPPELLDLVEFSNLQIKRVLYPDPPLPDQELSLLHRMAPDIHFQTLNESRP